MQTATSWLEQRIQDMIEHGADLGEDLPSLLVHVKLAKKMEELQKKEEYLRGYKEGIDSSSTHQPD